MTEQGETRQHDHELHEQVAELLKVLPSSGIAYRGDITARTTEIQRDGLISPNSNYIVLLPSTMRPEQVSAAIQEGIAFALTYADILGSPAEPIIDPDFVDFTSYYREHPDQIYGISWFTSPTQDQFRDVAKKGRTWYGTQSVNQAGDVRTFGEIPPSLVHSPIIATIEDITKAQESVTNRLFNGNVSKELLNLYRSRELREKHPTYFKAGRFGAPFIQRALEAPFHGFSADLQTTFGTDYLRSLGRKEFHTEISGILTKKFINTVTMELKS